MTDRDDYYSPQRTNLGLGTAATEDVGTGAGTVAAGDDARLSDARTPTAHAASHGTGGGDAISPASIGAATTAQGALATTAVQPGDITDVVRDNDSRLTDARTPTAHAASHSTGGTDAIAPGDIGAATAASLDALKVMVPTTKTGDYTFGLGDGDGATVGDSGSALTFTVPAHATVAFPVGTILPVYAKGAGQITITGAVGVTVTALNGTKSAGQGALLSVW